MKLLLPFFFLLLACSPAPAQEADLSFARSLLREGDHFRAVTEYKRVLHRQPEGPQAPAAALGIAKAYLGARRWVELESALDRLIRDYPRSHEAKEALLLQAGSAWKKGNFSLARQRYGLLLVEQDFPELESDLHFAVGWSLLEQDRFDEAAFSFASADAPGDELGQEALKFKALPEKSPRLAGTLSALLPGAGQLYAGRKRSALLAFSLNAAFILGALEAFENDTPVVGGILLFFEAGWYGGNIFNAVNSTHKYNRDLRQRAKADLRKRLGLHLLLEDDWAGLALRGEF